MPPMTKEQFSAAIAKAVAESGERRVVLAERASISESGIRAIEGGRTPSVLSADRLLRVLGLRMEIGDPAGATIEVEPVARRRRKSD